MPSKIYQVKCFLKENSRSLIDLVSDREDVEGFFAFRKQESLHECPSKSPQLLDKELLQKCEFQSLAMTLLINMKEIFWHMP